MQQDSRANWVAAAVEENQLEAMGKMAGIFAAFYQGLVDSGLDEDVCIQLTAAYIKTMVTNGIQAGRED